MTPMRPDEEMPEDVQTGGTEETSDPGLPVEDPGMEGAAGPGVGGLLGGVAPGGPGPMDSSALSDEDLAGMVEGDMDPEAQTAEELMAALENPETPPEVKQMIEMQLATAARRRMAGLVGGGGM